METIILTDGTTIHGKVENTGFCGLFWVGEFWDRFGFQHIVTSSGDKWHEF